MGGPGEHALKFSLGQPIRHDTAINWLGNGSISRTFGRQWPRGGRGAGRKPITPWAGFTKTFASSGTRNSQEVVEEGPGEAFWLGADGRGEVT